MNRDNALYWVWLSLTLGFNQHKIGKLFSVYHDISTFYNGKEFEWRLCGLFNSAELKRLVDTDLKSAERILESCNKSGIDVISIESANYPDGLRNIYAPPAVIYVRGKLPDFSNNLSIAMVGTRNATEYGMKTTFDFSYNLAKYGVTIISGGALGIDSAAHNGVLRAGGITVCVLGCGIGYDYLRQNKKMRNAIEVSGALVSEYPPDMAPKPYHFPARNRIISALSNGVLVLEAGSSSGALITANCALEQGKEVFAVMGNIDSPMSKGTNALIKDGAVPVSDFRDILNYYPNLYSVNSNQEKYSSSKEEIMAIPVKGKLPENFGNKKVKSVGDCGVIKSVHRSDINLEEFTLKVYEAIDESPVHIDDLAVKLSVPLFRLLPVITELEIQGLIKNAGGRCYQLV